MGMRRRTQAHTRNKSTSVHMHGQGDKGPRWDSLGGIDWLLGTDGVCGF